MKARIMRSALCSLALLVSLFLTYSARPAAARAADLSHRYVLFLGGINSLSSETGEPIDSQFSVTKELSVIRQRLQGQGFPSQNFVYFSYSAARYEARLENGFCNGWVYSSGRRGIACKGGVFVSSDGLRTGDLGELSANPVYAKEDTHLSIEQQSQALNWLIGQIVSVDQYAQIDLVGFSLGGIVASHWAATYRDSGYWSNVRSLVMLNSPVGGFRVFDATSNCGINVACSQIIRPIIENIFGAIIPRQLQRGSSEESLIASLQKATLLPAVTSIESANDYLVSGRYLRFLYPTSADDAALCQGLEFTVPIGEGARSWPPHRSLPDPPAPLGGENLSRPLCLNEVQHVLLSNHTAALNEPDGDPSVAARAADLVLQAIQSPPSSPQRASAILTLPTSSGADACTAATLPANDDGSSPSIPLPFSLNFFGTAYRALYVNNNGSITFDAPLDSYIPFDLHRANRAIIAPLFADVDTRAPGSGAVTYSPADASYQGRPAFCANWTDVGSFEGHTDKRNSFQLVLIDRSDVGPGDFDIMFNYAAIQWDTADAAQGASPASASARAGFSNGGDLAFELPGSGVSGAFLDSAPASGLINQSLNAAVPGQYRFEVRNGAVSAGDTMTSPAPTAITPTASAAPPTAPPVGPTAPSSATAPPQPPTGPTPTLVPIF